MERTPEPELMTDEEQARAYSEADFSVPHDRFVAEFRRLFGPTFTSRHVVDLGCGPGDVTVRFARAHPDCTVDGIDASAAMLAQGERRIAAEGLASRVRLILAHLPEGSAPRASYDVVLSNSLLHHLRDPGVMWASVQRFAGPGAAVFVMDLRRPASLAAARELVEVHAASEPDVLRTDFFNSLLAAYTPEEIEAQLGRSSLRTLTVERLGDRHVLVHGRLPARDA